jgi:hypothetical protein
VGVQEHHDLADHLPVGPAGGDLPGAILADAVDLAQALRSLLELVLRRGVQVDALSDPADTDLDAPFVPLLQDLSFDELPTFQVWLGEARERAAQVYRSTFANCEHSWTLERLLKSLAPRRICSESPCNAKLPYLTPPLRALVAPAAARPSPQLSTEGNDHDDGRVGR